jgi:hypothetical protein
MVINPVKGARYIFVRGAFRVPAQSWLNRAARQAGHPRTHRGAGGKHGCTGDRGQAGAWHAVTQQLASCAAAEAVDFALIRPGCMAGAAWLLLRLPGGIWLGFLAGKAVADVFWYGAEASVRRGLGRPGVA